MMSFSHVESPSERNGHLANPAAEAESKEVKSLMLKDREMEGRTAIGPMDGCFLPDTVYFDKMCGQRKIKGQGGSRKGKLVCVMQHCSVYVLL
jgi:hypothetical protein